MKEIIIRRELCFQLIETLACIVLAVPVIIFASFNKFLESPIRILANFLAGSGVG